MLPGSDDGRGTPAAEGTARVDGDTAASDSDADQGALARAEERLRYALADLENLRKRIDRTVAQERVAERERCTRVWIPVLDDLDRAVDEAEATSSPLTAGVELIRDSALAAMDELGFSRMDALGEPFDPMFHEAMGTVPSDTPAGTIIGVVRPGYGHDPVLRPAGVMVSRGPS